MITDPVVIVVLVLGIPIWIALSGSSGAASTPETLSGRGSDHVAHMHDKISMVFMALHTYARLVERWTRRLPLQPQSLSPTAAAVSYTESDCRRPQKPQV